MKYNNMLKLLAIVFLLTPIVVKAPIDTYSAVNSNKTEVGAKGYITSYQPTTNDDHRDYMIYMKCGDKYTYGAGVRWVKTGNVINNNYLIYSYKDTEGVLHYQSAPGPGNGRTTLVKVWEQSSSCWVAKSNKFQKTKCFPGFIYGIPVAASRVFSEYPPDTIKAQYTNLQFAWSIGSSLVCEDFNVDRNDVYIVENKCHSDTDDIYTNNSGTNYTIDFLDGTKTFGTGPPQYTPDECYTDKVDWESLGE